VTFFLVRAWNGTEREPIWKGYNNSEVHASKILGFPCCCSCACVAGGSRYANADWQLVWSDEFDGTNIDTTKWGFDIGGGGWGNSELEYYTSRTNNARIEAGNLIIEARKESFTGKDGITRNYTSARLKTQGLASWTYGRIEARIQIPSGQACGRRFGRSAPTSRPSAGPNAARLTSW